MTPALSRTALHSRRSTPSSQTIANVLRWHRYLCGFSCATPVAIPGEADVTNAHEAAFGKETGGSKKAANKSSPDGLQTVSTRSRAVIAHWNAAPELSRPSNA